MVISARGRIHTRHLHHPVTSAASDQGVQVLARRSGNIQSVAISTGAMLENSYAGCSRCPTYTTPLLSTGKNVVDINHYRWQKHCPGLLEFPVTA
jgi:hypothetical protein